VKAAYHPEQTLTYATTCLHGNVDAWFVPVTGAMSAHGALNKGLTGWKLQILADVN
jgi:hypothetical protein